MADTYYVNREHGHLLTYSEMLKEAREMYDFDDPTCMIGLDEYYCKLDDWPHDPLDYVDDDEDSPYWDDDCDYEAGFDPYEGCYTYDC